MTTLTNSFEGHTSGALTPGSGGNTGGASGNFFDLTPAAGGNTLVFDTTHGGAHGSVACKSQVVTSTGAFVRWTTQLGGNKSAVYLRAYFYLTSYTCSDTLGPLLLGATSDAATNGVGLVSYSNSGHIQVVPGGTPANGTATAVSTSVIPLNTWVRIEASFAASGSITWRYYASPDSATITETKTGTGTSIASINRVHAGIANAVATAGPYWFDDFAASDVTWPGPAVTTWTLGGPAASSSSAAGKLALPVITGHAVSVPAAAGRLGWHAAITASASSASAAAGSLRPYTPVAGHAASPSAAATAGFTWLGVPRGSAVTVPAASGGFAQAMTLAGDAESPSAAPAAMLTQRRALSGSAASVSAAAGLIVSFSASENFAGLAGALAVASPGAVTSWNVPVPPGVSEGDLIVIWAAAGST